MNSGTTDTLDTNKDIYDRVDRYGTAIILAKNLSDSVATVNISFKKDDTIVNLIQKSLPAGTSARYIEEILYPYLSVYVTNNDTNDVHVSTIYNTENILVNLGESSNNSLQLSVAEDPVLMSLPKETESQHEYRVLLADNTGDPITSIGYTDSSGVKQHENYIALPVGSTNHDVPYSIYFKPRTRDGLYPQDQILTAIKYTVSASKLYLMIL